MTYLEELPEVDLAIAVGISIFDHLCDLHHMHATWQSWVRRIVPAEALLVRAYGIMADMHIDQHTKRLIRELVNMAAAVCLGLRKHTCSTVAVGSAFLNACWWGMARARVGGWFSSRLRCA